MKNIIVAVDFSNATPGVTQIAVDLAKAFGANLELFHVIEPEPSYTAYGFTPDEFPAISVDANVLLKPCLFALSCPSHIRHLIRR